MKRAFSFDYSSDEEVDALLAEALDAFERQMLANDDDWFDTSDDDDQRMVDELDVFEDD